MDTYALLIASTLSAGTVLALAALGLLINEKVGVVNLGAEGIMLCAALAGFATVVHSGSEWLGFASGALVGAAMAALLGVLVIWLNANQYAAGLAMALFGSGLSAFAGTPFVSAQIPAHASYAVPGLADIAFVGPALFRHHPLVYLTVALAIAIAWYFGHTRSGLVLRSIGENPKSAHALGYPVRWIRLGAVAVGGALCGIAGAYLSITYTSLWSEGMVSGKGWIALALTTFATWRAARVVVGAYLFTGVTMLSLHLQSVGIQIPSQFLAMMPYVTTIVVLAIISRNPQWIRVNQPASLGQPFFPNS